MPICRGIGMNRIGVDIVSNRRIENSLSESFLRHVLSEAEMAEYLHRKDSVAYVAGRFAAKEAILKCLVDKKITDLTEISVINGPSGEPIVEYGNFSIRVSISHEIDYTVAVAILETEE